MVRSLVSLMSIFTINLFALTPFSLEGVKQINVKVLDKSKFTSDETLNKIKIDVNEGLKNLGIQTKSDQFSNFIVKIQGEKFGEKYALHISMFIVEESFPLRNKEKETMSITYYKDDFFDTNQKDLQGEIYDSIIKYLLDDFIEQFKEENG